jgi:hypothetical protein
MSTNLGQLEAQRILRARQSDAERTAQQGREERILCTEQPRFFSTMADHLVEIVNSFNKEMGLEGEDAVTFTHSGSEMYLGKKASPFFLRKIMHFERTNEVLIRTQIINGYQKGVKEEKWYFDIQRGELRLNYKNFVECGDLLFKDIPDLFR